MIWASETSEIRTKFVRILDVYTRNFTSQHGDSKHPDFDVIRFSDSIWISNIDCIYFWLFRTLRRKRATRRGSLELWRKEPELPESLTNPESSKFRPETETENSGRGKYTKDKSKIILKSERTNRIKRVVRIRHEKLQPYKWIQFHESYRQINSRHERILAFKFIQFLFVSV